MKIITKGIDRAISGGSWYYYVFFSRMSYRRGYSPVIRSYDCGFRVARRVK